MRGGERVVIMGVCVCEKMGERKSQVKVKKQLGGKRGKEKPKINLDLKVKSQSSTESGKKKHEKH